MDEKYIRERITALRMKKGVSEYKMSLDLGHSKSYVQSISSGKSLPSLPELLYICDYLGVAPSEFFDDSMDNPALVNRLLILAKGLPEEDLIALIGMAERLALR